MPRSAALALVAAAALFAAGCGTSACQKLGEKICGCQPGMTTDTCKTQVQDQLNQLGVDTAGFNGMLDHVAAGEPVRFEDFCQQRLDACVPPANVDFCEWLLTADGEDACGLTPTTPSP